MARRICLAAVAAILLFVTMAAVGYSSEQEGNDVVPTPVNRGTGARVLRANLTTNPITVDPAKAVAESELLLVRTLFDTLVEYQDGNIKPAIADSWLYSDDGKELYIQLRSDAKFSNGKPITSSDVEFSLERILDSNTASPYAVLLAPYLARGAASDAVEPIDERSLVIRFSKPRWDFLELLGHPAFSIVSEENVQNYNFGHAGTFLEPAVPVVGSGPLKMVEWVDKRNITLEPNRHYYSVKPKIDRVELVVDDTLSTTIYDFGAENLDIAYLRTGDTKAMLLENPFLMDKLFTGSTIYTYFLSINPQTEFFRNIQARQAVIAAIDTAQITETSEIFANTESPLGRLPGFFTGDPRKILESMGYGKDGKMPQLVLSYPPGEVASVIAQNIKDQLESSLGVTVRLQEMQHQGAALVDNSAHLSLVQWTVPYSGKGAFFSYFFGQGVNPFTGHSSLGKVASEYLDQLGNTKEASKRDQYYSLISNEISKEMILYGLVDVKNLYAIHEKDGVVPGSLKKIFGITDVSKLP